MLIGPGNFLEGPSLLRNRVLTERGSDSVREQSQFDLPQHRPNISRSLKVVISWLILE